MKTEKRLDVRQRPKKKIMEKKRAARTNQEREGPEHERGVSYIGHTVAFGQQWCLFCYTGTLSEWIKRRMVGDYFWGAVVPPMLKYLLFILDDAAKIGVCFQQRTVQRRREGCRRTALMSED